MHSPLVSIITPNYNSERFIEKTIQSVLAQTEQNWEMIIVDDGSQDMSPMIIREYSEKDSRIKFLLTNLVKYPKLIKGPGSARNTGIEYATGEYIAFLDSDDLWHPEKLEKQIGFMSKNTYKFTYTWYDIIDENSHVIGSNTRDKEKLDYYELLKDCPIGCLTVIYNAKHLGKQYIDLNKYDQYTDYSLWLKITKLGHSAYCLQEKLGLYRLAKGSISSNKLKAIKHQWNILRKVEKLGLFTSMYYLLFYLRKGVINKSKYVIARLIS